MTTAAEAAAPATPILTFDHTDTADFWDTDHRAVIRKPTHAAYRGGHRLPHMSQQLGRDLAGEGYTRKTYTLDVTQWDDEARERRNSPYRYVVTQSPATAHTAFQTAEELYAWCSAYAVTLTPRPARWCGDFTAAIGDPADWQPLEIRAL